MKKQVEILSPAGSYNSLKAAIAAGADAVYIGGSRFGARAYADNLSEEQLLEAIDYVHLHGRKIYLTVNTLLKENELQNELYDYLLPYYKQGLDAVIVQDIGVLKFIREQFPDLPIHASTQMTITNLLGAKLLEDLGVERVVTAREMQLDEIKEIATNSKLEIESFVHGALCYCYSGQCLYSSVLGGRSGNRGQCAQPCRLPYRVNGDRESQYVLSLKDICTLEYIPELVEVGIHSFKIEGRMKKPEYVALVTAMYRKYVDLYFEKGKQGFQVDPKDREKLMDIYNRGGSHGGYYYTKNGREMLSLKRPNHAGVPAIKVCSLKGKSITAKALVDIEKGDIIELPDGENFTFAQKIREGQNLTFVSHNRQNVSEGTVLNRTRNEHLLEEIKTILIEQKVKEKINGKLTISLSEPIQLSLYYGDIVVNLSGDTPQEAVNQPIDCDRIERQMRKTGNTEFEFDELEIRIEGNLFIPMQSLNELRRIGLQMLEGEILRSYRRNKNKNVSAEKTSVCVAQSPGEDEKFTAPLYVYVEDVKQWEEALLWERVSRIYLDCNAVSGICNCPDIADIISQTHLCGKEIYLGMPHIFRAETIRKYRDNYEQLLQAGWDGVLIRNYESYMFLREHGYDKGIVTDYNLYQFNRYARGFWEEQQVESTTAPLELNYKELKMVGLENSELVIYGHYPMMVSTQCIQKTTGGCTGQKGKLTIKDRYQKVFTVKNHCDYCYNIIYNTAPLVLTDQKAEILDLNPKALRMHFTMEDRTAMANMMNLYEKVFYQDACGVEPNVEFTRGHFKRGIK